ncbi:hypothetical protein TRFO_36213 [Tritrichomonas foetus]|uniref:Uncharacterized protein n=1 Tax=Tritrichomonas foetus TaxID=1144522 RepID=A0A1J4JH19_9EUKA|nr:hypothetical protein TRFO_36213 [Tritrichomonas foetus]|eukprot:OHS97559.1 hypothetical protein TRFO_36213 [Tritrichomonas foetus]
MYNDALINQIGEGEKFGINTPDNHPAAVELVQEITGTYNIYKKFSNKRMYACGLPTNLQTYKFFSLLSLTVG